MPAEVLWPQREDLYSLMMLRATIGEAAFEAEKNSNPVDPALAEWPADYFDWPGFLFEVWPRDVKIRVMSLDPSKGREARSGDYSAICWGSKDAQGQCFYDLDLERRPTEKMLADVCKRVREFGPDLLVVEANQYQELLEGPLREAAKASSTHLPELRMVENTVNKNVRIRRLGPDFAQRLVRMRKNSPGVALTIRQLMDFPNGRFDDGADSMEMCRRYLNDAPRWEVR